MNKTIHDSEIISENKQVITACAFIHENFNGIEKVFLPKRALTKKFLPGVYELSGGHINFGEDIIIFVGEMLNQSFEYRRKGDKIDLFQLKGFG